MLDVIQFKPKKDGGWRANRIGYAYKTDKGELNVEFDALPMPDAEGRCRVVIALRKEREPQNTPPPAPLPGAGDFEDSIPFGPDR